MFLFFLKVNMTASKCAEYMELGRGILISSCTPALQSAIYNLLKTFLDRTVSL